MEIKKLFIVIGTLLLVWIIGSLISSWGFNDKTQTNTENDILAASHVFKEGIHILSGGINLPTPCHQISHDVFTVQSFPEQVTIDFSITNLSEFCAQVITTVPFEIVVPASENATFNILIDGDPVEVIF